MARLFDRLEAATAYVTSNGRFDQAFRVFWQKFAERLEGEIERQQELIDALEEQLALIQQAQAKADTAATREAISGSFTKGSNILSAIDAGASATITIAAHERHYSDESRAALSLTGGRIDGLLHSTKYYVFYDDTTLANTAPTYQATTFPAQAQANRASGRHLVGSITTPAAGSPPSSGGGTLPPGGGGTGGGVIP